MSCFSPSARPRSLALKPTQWRAAHGSDEKGRKQDRGGDLGLPYEATPAGDHPSPTRCCSRIAPTSAPLDTASDLFSLWFAGGEHPRCSRCVQGDGLGIKDSGPEEEIHPTTLAGAHAPPLSRPCFWMQHHAPLPSPHQRAHRHTRLTSCFVCCADGQQEG